MSSTSSRDEFCPGDAGRSWNTPCSLMGQYSHTTEHSSLECFNQTYHIPALLLQVILDPDCFWIILLLRSVLHQRDEEPKTKEKKLLLKVFPCLSAKSLRFRKLKHTVSLGVRFTSLLNNLGMMLAHYLPISTLAVSSIS